MEQQPTHNPDSIIMADGPHCGVHGWTAGNSYATVPFYRTIDGPRDSNGYNIYVQSSKYNRAVYLSDIEYSLPQNTENEQNN